MSPKKRDVYKCDCCEEEKVAEYMILGNLCRRCREDRCQGSENPLRPSSIPVRSHKKDVLRCLVCREIKAIEYFARQDLCKRSYIDVFGVEPEEEDVSQDNTDIAQQVNGIILDLLYQGKLPPWKMGFEQPNPRNAISEREYQGINYWITLAQQIKNDWNDSRWLTKNQTWLRGGEVKEGEMPTSIYFYTLSNDGLPILIAVHQVYNLEQTTVALLTIPTIPPVTSAEHIIESMPQKPRIRHLPAMTEPAHYLPHEDLIEVPTPQQFDPPERYYETVFHELAHSTGHPIRLNRFPAVQFRKETLHDYGLEELIAEMTAAMLCHKAGIGQRTVENMAAYIQNWRDTIRMTKNQDLILQASPKAQQALEFITP